MPALAPKERRELEPVLEEFEREVRNCRDNALPDMEKFLARFEGPQRDYLRKEFSELLRNIVRGNYVVLDQIDSGGMGVVSRVRHIQLGKELALKEIRAEFLRSADHDELRRRFQREIEASGRLANHPNIVGYTDTGVTQDGVPYLVMDYIEGQDLGKIVKRLGPLSQADAAQIIHDAAVGLQHAHERGLVHRDIKPSNLMISRYGVVKVLDFGLAKLTSGDHQRTAITSGQVMGTFDFMSPEQCREEPPDHRADIYSLGCTLYFLLGGQAPFAETRSQFGKMNAHQTTDPPPIEGEAAKGPLWPVLLKMMRKSPAERYASMLEVAAALRPHVVGSNLPALLGDATRDSSTSSMANADLATASVGPPGRGTERPARPHKTSRRVVDQTALAPQQPRGPGRRWRWIVAASLITVALCAALAAIFVPSKPSPDLAAEIGAMPGLNGRWWFEEAPWLLPEVRLALIKSLEKEPAAKREELLRLLRTSENVPEVYDTLLREYALPLSAGWPRATRNRLLTFGGKDPETLAYDELHKSLSSMAEELDGKMDQLSGAESHLGGTIYHWLEDLKKARDYYEIAIDRYTKEGLPILAALCQADLGTLLNTHKQSFDAASQFISSRQDLQMALGERPLPAAFAVHSFSMEADSDRRYNNNLSDSDLGFAQAAQHAERLPANHPLRAYLHERQGWRHFNTWHLDEAEQRLREALRIRRHGQDHNNARAAQFIFWDRQGLAMLQHFRGEAEAAQFELQSLLKEIDDSESRVSTRQQRELVDRRPNLYERLADTALFGKADGLDAVELLEKAIKQATSLGFKTDGREGILVRLHYKAAAAAALREDANSDVRDKKVASLLKDAARVEAELFPSAGTASSNKQADLFRLTKRAALAVAHRGVDRADPSDAEAKPLLALLEETTGSLQRDDLLLLLAAGERLLESNRFDAQEKASAAEQMQKLIKAQSFPVANGQPQIPALFQHYLDLTSPYARHK